MRWRRRGRSPSRSSARPAACRGGADTPEGFWRLLRSGTEAVCDIPYGETASYGEVAIAAGIPRAARAVGTACATTPFSVIVPVHRVVRADGSLGEYGGRPEVKKYLVELEQGLTIPAAPAGAAVSADAG